MRSTGITPPEVVEANVTSTSVKDRLLVTAWRDGRQRTPELEVTAYSFDWSMDRRVQGQCNLVIADPDGVLSPRRISDPLAPGGARLRIAYQYGATGLTIQLGWWRIRRVEPHLHPPRRTRLGSSHFWIPGGGTIALQADEELASLELDRLDVGHRHPERPTIMTEIAHLIHPYLALDLHPQVGSLTIPDSIEYSEYRLEAIQHLLDRVDATYRMGDGTLEVIPAKGTPADTVIRPLDGGSLISIAYTMSDQTLVNGVTSWVETDDGEVLVGRARIEGGPLAWGGPFGRVPVFRGANLATTQEQVNQDALSTLERLATVGDVMLTVETLCRPHLQLGDQVKLVSPDFPEPRQLTGRVHSITWSGRNGVAGKGMTLSLAVPHAQWLEA